MSSQSSKHLDWCLRKAEKELEECKKQKKKLRHRGLRKIEANQKLALEHINKARHYLKALQLLRKQGFSDIAVSMGFYSLYHCFLAIGTRFGYESKNQTYTIALIESLQEEGRISLKPEIIEYMKYEEEQNDRDNSVIELREDYTYGVDLEVRNKDQLDRIEKLCIDLLDATAGIIQKN
ncbi:MAG: hypothetical protein AABX12_05020 [Nanoarchaeota archaeon]